MNYRETPCSGILGDLVECEWSLRTDRVGAVVHPDGCADLLFDDAGGIYVAGIADQSRPLDARLSLELRGLRLKVGAIPFFFDIPASEFLNQVTAVADLASPLARALILISKHADSRDGLVSDAVRVLSRACSRKTRPQRLSWALSQMDSTPLRSMASSLGITERQMHRLFLREAGVSPSRLKRIRRLQRVVDALRRLPLDLSMAGFALDLGFFDQAHMNHDLRDLTGMTPGALHRSVAAGVMSERYKTSGRAWMTLAEEALCLLLFRRRNACS